MSIAASSEVFGVLAEFDGPKSLFHACEKVRDAGYKDFDAYTPFPVHGLDKAMGLKASIIPWIVLVTGLLGASFGMWLQWWTSAVDYPLIISGKPLFSWQAFIPVTFEVGILFGALGAVIGMLVLNKLPMYYHPTFHSELFSRGVTDDKFFIGIEAKDEKFDQTRTVDMLRKLGATQIEVLGH